MALSKRESAFVSTQIKTEKVENEPENRLGVETPTPREQSKREGQATHTPGPWEIHSRRTDNPTIWNRDGSELIADVTGMVKHRAANARLIAAAPELLQAVRDAIEFIGANHSLLANRKADAMDCQLRAAIAKAEGRRMSPDTKSTLGVGASSPKQMEGTLA